MNILFDLDGTLLDSRLRLYNLFNHLVPESKFSFEEYWDLKRQGIGHAEILSTYFHKNEQQIQDFQSQWMSLIEAPEWLKYDVGFEGVTEKLTQLKANNDLYIVTARQLEAPVFDQVEKLGWTNLFTKILVTEQKYSKIELIEQHVNLDVDSVMIGDTGKDILTGKGLNIKAIAVLSGFLNKEKLEDYSPDELIESVLDLSL